jgi:hypothetical protein
VFFLLARRLFRHTGWALLAVLFLCASPRLFADAFYNSKDIPFMAVFITAVWAMLLLIDQVQSGASFLTTAARLGWHSLVTGALISTRVAGILIPALTVILLLAAVIQDTRQMKRSLLLLVLYLSLTAGLTLLFWPILWHAPMQEFIQALGQMSNFPYPMQMLYQGQFYNVGDLPWHYLPVWFGVTTPLVIVALGAAGIIVNAFQQASRLQPAWKVRRLLRALCQPEQRGWLAVSIWLAAPVAAVYILHAALYDGWRHMFFVYPAWVLFAVNGLRHMLRWLAGKPGLKPDWLSWGKFNLGQAALAALVCLGLAEPLVFMLRCHPHQNVYFNWLAGSSQTMRSRFELDYWGLSYKQAIDYILAHEAADQILIYLNNPPGRQYIDNTLPPQDSARLVRTSELSQARYFVTEFRWHPQDYPFPPAWYSIQVRGVEIMAVYKLR